MGIFSNIASAIFGHSHATGTSPPTGTAAKPGAPAGSAASPGTMASTGSAAPGAVQPITKAEVEAMIAKRAAGQGEQLDWRRSIVDLMKALDLDSSLTARKELAKELHYTGDTNDSATMNVWLHKQVMTKLAANGGKLPADIKT